MKNLLNRDVDYIVSESLSVLQSLLRKYPGIIEEFSKYLEPAIIIVENDRAGLASLIWILGEFGNKVDNSPYIIENLIDQFSNDIQSPEIIYALLLAGCKLFFKSPGEMQIIVGRIFEMILKNYHDVDLRDRTYYFYNLMEKNIELAENIICGEGATVDNFYSDLDDEYLEQIFSQFNTLSVVYGKPEEKFIKSSNLDDTDITLKKKDYDNMYDDNLKLNYENNNGTKNYYSHANSNNPPTAGLIDTNDLLGFSGTTTNNYTPSTNIIFSNISFKNLPDFDEQKYQNMWTNAEFR